MFGGMFPPFWFDRPQPLPIPGRLGPSDKKTVLLVQPHHLYTLSCVNIPATNSQRRWVDGSIPSFCTLFSSLPWSLLVFRKLSSPDYSIRTVLSVLRTLHPDYLSITFSYNTATNIFIQYKEVYSLQPRLHKYMLLRLKDLIFSFL